MERHSVLSFRIATQLPGTEYNSSEHTEGLPFPNTEEAARQMVRGFPVGSSVEVAVSPTDPKCAVLETGFPKMWQILRRASVVFFVVGAAIALLEVLTPK
jgi:hypothetical protein